VFPVVNEFPRVSATMPIDTVGVNLIEATGCVPSDSDKLILVGRVAGPHNKLGNGRPVMTFDCNQ
jgi:hypothetical protein